MLEILLSRFGGRWQNASFATVSLVCTWLPAICATSCDCATLWWSGKGLVAWFENKENKSLDKPPSLQIRICLPLYAFYRRQPPACNMDSLSIVTNGLLQSSKAGKCNKCEGRCCQQLSREVLDMIELAVTGAPDREGERWSERVLWMCFGSACSWS